MRLWKRYVLDQLGIEQMFLFAESCIVDLNP
jgi:hypothetical protein